MMLTPAARGSSFWFNRAVNRELSTAHSSAVWRVTAFCRRFASFLQGDGRHHLWIGSTVNAGLLIYDQHDWIWAYGDLPAYVRVLQSRGFAEGEVRLPVPHSHSYHAAFDAAEDELAGYWEWSHYSLQPGDEY
jgi:hypothetical protein